ncbi:MAG: hypothetical protein Tsb002_38550 [Wenzhouxiangellaceae bacterium]
MIRKLFGAGTEACPIGVNLSLDSRALLLPPPERIKEAGFDDLQQTAEQQWFPRD